MHAHYAEATEHSSVEVGVVIVNYNVKDLLAQCLRSLQASLTGIPSHIIVVDNNSTDGSVEYLRELFPEVEFYALQENLGFGRANNIGFQRLLALRVQYVLCLNPDTLVSEDTIRVMIQYMETHPRTGLAGCKLLNADGTFQMACRRGFPTPWASFCKIFGLQALFPRSRWFAQYNQTFRSENETYNVDAVSGAFMFLRRETLQAVQGFDEAFFMYGEDLDLCYRVTLAGQDVAYVHSTSVIHYKGESTRRSALNEVRVFYEAMEIFARKHFGASWLVLLFLRVGIWLRALLAQVLNNATEFGFLLWDGGITILALLVATKIRFGEYWGLPDYAYPVVPLVVVSVVLFALLAAGEYSPYQKPSVRKVFSGQMASFFVLSALPYFFKDYAFSRGGLILLIVLSGSAMAVIRVIVGLIEQARQTYRRRIIFVGNNPTTAKLVEVLSRRTSEIMLPLHLSSGTSLEIIGVVATATDMVNETASTNILPLLGEMSYLPKIIRQTSATEVIITDTTIPYTDMIRMMMDVATAPAFDVTAESGVPSTSFAYRTLRGRQRPRLRFAREYDDVVAAQIIEEYTTTNPITQYNMARWQYRVVKRISDALGSLFLLSIGLPVVFLLSKQHKRVIRLLFDVLRGHLSLVGLYLPEIQALEQQPSKKQSNGKRSVGSTQYIGLPGLIGLAHIHSPEQLTSQTIQRINEFYAQHYTPWLDFDIIVTFCLQRVLKRRAC